VLASGTTGCSTSLRDDQGQGDVVVLMRTDNDDGMFGDLLATSFRARGGLGLGHRCGRARRTHALEKFPVWSKRHPR
jgi:regulator of RNase E activity RraA